MEHTFEIVKYNVLDDGSTLYHIYITSPEHNRDNPDFNTSLLYQYNEQLYYKLFRMHCVSYHKIFDDFYNIKPIINKEINAFDITINGIIINKYIQLYLNRTYSHSHYTYPRDNIICYIQNNLHLLDVGEPYVLK